MGEGRHGRLRGSEQWEAQGLEDVFDAIKASG
jgi:hypothetical protein